MIEITLRAGSLEATETDALVVLAPSGAQSADSFGAGAIDAILGGLIGRLLNAGDFTGKAEQVAVLYPPESAAFKRVVLVGTGNGDVPLAERVRRAAAVAGKCAQDVGAKHVAICGLPDPVEATTTAVAEGLILGLYTFDSMKSKAADQSKIEHAVIVCSGDVIAEAEAGLRVGMALARATSLARDLTNLPPNVCTPAYLAEIAVRIAGERGLQVEVLERGQMQAIQMGALLAVAQAAHNPPRFIVLQHNAHRSAELDTLVLVGKGVTFDTGGYSLKTRDGMIGMKGDMSGAAAVLGAMQAVSELQVEKHVVGIIPASENLVDAAAYRPQDVITASNGKTIEIISTDAEGRLLLADALVYAKRFAPDAVVDIATLTGSAAAALGGVYSAVFATDVELRRALEHAGETVFERVWPMPMAPEYRKQIDSDTADMRNSSTIPKAGASVATMFLAEFVDYPVWAHVDMAGTFVDSGASAYIPAKGMSGYGARLLTQFVIEWTTRKGV
ncbi:MAG: leucyl aminopeptidase [Chloroflexi bacterium]|nr:leucyl aminopeptidase [Chloroflexota bacterium]